MSSCPQPAACLASGLSALPWEGSAAKCSRPLPRSLLTQERCLQQQGSSPACWSSRASTLGPRGGTQSQFQAACILLNALCDPMDSAHQAPLSMGFSRQGHWRGLPCPLPGELPDPGMEPASLSLQHWQAGSLPLVPPGRLQAACILPTYSPAIIFWKLPSPQASHSEHRGLGSRDLDSSLGSALNYLCDFQKSLHSHLWPSVSPSVKWGQYWRPSQSCRRGYEC